MRCNRFLALFCLLVLTNCGPREHSSQTQVSSASLQAHPAGKCALLLTRFKSLEELKELVQIEYYNIPPGKEHALYNNSYVRIVHASGGREITSILQAGVDQGDIELAYKGSFRDRVGLILRCPFILLNRKDLMGAYAFSRRRDLDFGERDIAFYDIAETMTYRNLRDTDPDQQRSEDLSEKGYINTFNHVVAQAFMTSLYSERLADFVADTHERDRLPELISGKFTAEQIVDLETGALDNYVDIINNEWGQELGKQLRDKYHIRRSTVWTAQLLTNYLNDIQAYCAWTFGISFKPFRSDDELVIKFTDKLNQVMNEAPEVLVR